MAKLCRYSVASKFRNLREKLLSQLLLVSLQEFYNSGLKIIKHTDTELLLTF